MSSTDENLYRLWFEGYEYSLYRVELFVNPVIASLANVLAIYVIVCHSPTNMAHYRWFLLNIVVRIEPLQENAK